MARIKGIDLPKNKRGVVSLTYIYGIGSAFAADILDQAKVSHDIKVQDWTDDQANKIRSIASRGHMNLIETFAERIVSCCKEDVRIKRVKIRIEKPRVIKGALSAGVKISRDVNQN